MMIKNFSMFFVYLNIKFSAIDQSEHFILFFLLTEIDDWLIE